MMLLRHWGVAVSLGLIACGRSTSDRSLDSVGVGGSAMSAPAGAGGSVSGGAGASAAVAGAFDTPIAGSAGSHSSGAGGDASLAGAAGLSGNGGGGGDGAGAGAGGPAVLGPDPQPAAAPVAAVATSNSYLVFRLGGSGGSGMLMLLDLKGGGQPVQVNAAGSKLFQPAASPDGRFVVHVQNDPFPFTTPRPVPANDAQLSAFTDSGYVPAAVVAGFDGVAALHYAEGFDASSRFAFLVRTSKVTGLDIVDGANNRRHGSLNGVLVAGGTISWAPKGYLFSYRVDSSTPTGTVTQKYLAKVIAGGISEPQLLPDSVTQSSFTPDGRRLFYSVGVKVPAALGYIDPPAAARQIYAHVASNGVSGLGVEASGQSVLTALSDTTDAARSLVTRIFVDPTRSPQPITEPNRSSAITMSESGSLAALTLGGDTTQRLEFLRGNERIKVAEAPIISAFFSGEQLVYYLWDSDTDPSSELHSATLVGSSVVDRRLDPVDRDFRAYPRPKLPRPGNKYFDACALPVPGIRFSDLELDGPSATRTVDATNPAAVVERPVCNAVGNACAYVEHTDTSSKLFLMHYDATGPSAPMLVFQSDLLITLYATHVP